MTEAAAPDLNIYQINQRALANLNEVFLLLWGGKLPGKPSVHVLRLNPWKRRRCGRPGQRASKSIGSPPRAGSTM